MLTNGLQGSGSTINGAQGTSSENVLTVTLTLNGVSYQDDGNYSLFVTNNANNSVSSTAAALIVSDPYITTQPPANVPVELGSHGTIAIAVLAAGSGVMTYQWFSSSAGSLNNGGNFSGVTTPTLTISGIQSADAGNYYVKITGANGTVQSSDANVFFYNAITAPTVYPLTVLSNHPIAYWRLDETNGLTAYDSVGGHNCFYTNVELGLVGYNPGDPDTAVGFGLLATSNSYAGEVNNSSNGIAPIDFSMPPGSNAEFSIEAWVKGNAQTQDAGLVSKGYGGGEQFNLNTGSDTVATHGFQFFMHNTPIQCIVPVPRLRRMASGTIWRACAMSLMALCDSMWTAWMPPTPTFPLAWGCLPRRVVPRPARRWSVSARRVGAKPPPVSIINSRV